VPFLTCQLVRVGWQIELILEIHVSVLTHILIIFFIHLTRLFLRSGFAFVTTQYVSVAFRTGILTVALYEFNMAFGTEEGGHLVAPILPAVINAAPV